MARGPAALLRSAYPYPAGVTKRPHAIGSGAAAAQYALSILSHFEAKEQPLAYGKMLVYRVMKTVIEVAAYHLGPPIQMWVVDTRGAQELMQADLDGLEDAVAQWKELEKDTLRQFLSGQVPSLAIEAHADEAVTMPPETPDAAG